MDNVWLTLGIAGVGGIGVGIGLVIGMFVVRRLRGYLRRDNGTHEE
jgi:hypothetical protein